MAVTVPDWADTLLDLVGVNWPNVDEDAYREMADALREFADDLADDGQLANNHMERLLSSGHGEAMDALNQHWNKVKGRHLKDLVSSARTIAGALDMAAGAIEAMKWKAVAELGILAGQTGLAMALIPVTGGLSALLGAGAIAFTKKQLLKLITGAMEEAVGHIVGVMTEPAVAALENMAADLVVQLGADALGMQDGVDLGQTRQAGKDGFDEGVQGAKEGLNLASAGAGTGGGGRPGGKGFHIEHDEHDNAGTKLNGVSAGIHGRTAGKLTKAKTAQGRNKGRDSIADALDPVIEKAMGALAKSATTMGDHVGKTLPKVVKQISVDHKNNDDAIRDRLARQRKSDEGTGGPNGGPGTGNRKGGDLDTVQARPVPLKDAATDPRRHSVPLDKKKCENDPVDVATGEMTLTQTDLSLPGTLHLALSRTHLSEYRHGHWFGRGWASTLDERLEVDPVLKEAVWAREDGSLLVYPTLPLPGGEPVLPLEGPRLALAHGGQDGDTGTYTVTDPHTGVTRSFTGSPYRTSSAHWLTEIRDRNDHAITFSRRPDGAPTAVTHSGGYTVQVTVEDARVRTLALRTPQGPVTVMTYGYDRAGHLEAVTNSSGRPLRFGYDPEGRITSWTDRNDSTFRYVYDAAGRVVRTIGPDGFLSSTFDYAVHPDTGDRVTRYTDSTGATTVHQLNHRLQSIAETNPLGHTVRRTWDAYDRLLTETDPLGLTTTHEYDAAGRRTAVVHPDGHRSLVTYDDAGRPATVTARDGSHWHLSHDDRGNRTSVADPLGTVTSYAYDAAGRLDAVTDATGRTVRITSDRAGLPLAVTQPSGEVARFDRDAFGRPATTTDAEGRTTRMSWSTEGRLLTRTGPDGAEERWTYDGEGNCTSTTDASGAVTLFEYTHFDLPAARTEPDGARHEFRYDTERRLVGVVGPQGRTWTYEHDAAGRLSSETDFDGRTVTYAYDEAGRLVARTNGAGQTVRFERDPMGRVVRKEAGAAVTRFSYDPEGRLLHAVGPDAELSWRRDARGRVLDETCDGRTLRLAYDELGRPTRRTTPAGTTSEWDHGPSGWGGLVTASGHGIRFAHDAAGREASRHIEGVATLDHVWDTNDRLLGRRAVTRDGTVQARRYAHRPGGGLTSVDDRLSGTRHFELDPAGRVTAVDAKGWTERYAYDGSGNLTEATWPARHGGRHAAGPRRYDGTRIRRAGDVSYEYDGQGRTVVRRVDRADGSAEVWTYAWDAEDRLTAVVRPDGSRWSYGYDPLGRRVSKVGVDADGARILERTEFTWHGNLLVEQVSGGSEGGTLTSLTWDYRGRHPVAQTERKSLATAPSEEIDRRFFALVTDLVGTPTELIGEDGSVAWRARSTLWGLTSWNADATAYTPLRFPGQYFDAESGLHYNVHRYYDPETARYLSPDPLGLVPAPNPAAYVSNPHVLIDPLGLAPCDEEETGHTPAPPTYPVVVLGVNPPSDELMKYLRAHGLPEATTFNGRAFADVEAGSPVWMTNVMAAVSNPRVDLHITLDGMPGAGSTPESIAAAFDAAVERGQPFGTGQGQKHPPEGYGTAWEMSVVARNVVAFKAGEEDGIDYGGRSWESISWHSDNKPVDDVPEPNSVQPPEPPKKSRR
ncbi:RHS repeat-associated core domain-containing protein [Streptomyces narbonensis]